MIYFSENNWCSWQYNDGPLHSRSPADNAMFKTVYKPTDEPIGSLWDEAVKGAKSTIDLHPGLQPSLFFSGGVDSEVMLRAFLHIGSSLFLIPLFAVRPLAFSCLLTDSFQPCQRMRKVKVGVPM